jgi:hypothetical protein
MLGAILSLTPEQIAHFRSEGYVIVPDFFTQVEVSALQGEVARLQADGLLRNVSTEGDGKTTSQTAFNLQICPIELKSRLIAALPWRPGVPEVIVQLLGGDPVQHLDQIFLKPAKHGAGTNWHCDNAYFRSADPRHGVGMWCAVHAASRANGTMRFIPRSHLKAWEHVRDGGSDHHITSAAAVDVAQEVLVEVPAGGVAFFNYGVVHATGPNTTEHERAGLALHFVLGDQRPLQDPHFKDRGPETLRWLTGPRVDGGKAYHGIDLRGEWQRQVAPFLRFQQAGHTGA